MLHVSLRTLQNWATGVHEVPYAAHKLLKLLRLMELPGQSWAGWHFSRGQLVTPEGRTISGQEGSWWSLLVRQARGFAELYQQNHQLRASLDALGLGSANRRGREAAPEVGGGLVPFKTKAHSTTVQWGHNGAIIGPWPTISDCPPLSTKPPEPAPPEWASASTRSSVSPLMAISGETLLPLEPDKPPPVPQPHQNGPQPISQPQALPRPQPLALALLQPSLPMSLRLRHNLPHAKGQNATSRPAASAPTPSKTTSGGLGVRP